MTREDPNPGPESSKEKGSAYPAPLRPSPLVKTVESGRSVPPHPSPLPGGEGERSAVPAEQDAPVALHRPRGSLSPRERVRVRGKAMSDPSLTLTLAA